MGSCLSTGTKSKAETDQTSLCCDSASAGKGVNDMSRSNDKVSSVESPSNPQSEGEILQSPNFKIFRFNELQKATRNFRPDNLLGEGGFGRVFKGWVDENSLMASQSGTRMAVAVKKLNHNGRQGQEEWLAEIKYLGQLRHPNIVKLIGYCLEEDHRLLVYEFMPNGSLERHLFLRHSYSKPLSWNHRLKVALGAAKGLAFLHNKADVMHRDLKTSDILLDSDCNAKLSDFGLAKDGPVDDKTHVTTRVLFIHGYTDPEYLKTGHVSAKSDVFSFGVVFLEMITGRRAIDMSRPSGEQILVEWAKPYFNRHRHTFRIWDASIEGQCAYNCMLEATHLAQQCLSSEPHDRPSMGQVVQVLEKLYESSNKVLGDQRRGWLVH